MNLKHAMPIIARRLIAVLPLLNKSTLTLIVPTLIVFSSLSGGAYASAIEQFRQFASQVKSAKGEFTQSQVFRNGKREQLQGQFTFARPGKFRWLYSKPYEQVLVSDGEKFYLYDKDLEQVTVRKLGDAIGASPAAILFGNNDFEKHYKLSEEGVLADGLEWLSAIPKAKESQFEKIRIGWRNNLPEAMELRDALGKSTLLNFQRIERNPTLSNDLFRFVPSRDAKGADVLEQ